MKLFYGAQQNLSELIKRHLFIICANNSGTTFLKNALATSRNTWNLSREGQHTYGFAGPNSFGLGFHKCWAAKEEWIDIFIEPKNYEWNVIKQAWYFQAFSRNKDATVFVEKSPPFLLNVEQLINNFEDARFFFMVRNPYAMIEGVRRQSPKKWLDANSPKKIWGLAANHVINCLKYQKNNIEKWSNRGLFFTYEQMCSEPEIVETALKHLVPELDDLVLQQRLKVRGYDENLRNMNAQQIKRLTYEDKREINKVFSGHEEILNYFDYSMMS